MRPCRIVLATGVAVPLALAFATIENPADQLADRPIDAYHYDYAHRCLKHPQPGTLALKHWLEHNAAGSVWGIMSCHKLGPTNYSVHADGRAIDWRLDVHVEAQRRGARALIRRFLARDRAGHNHALARRMGIQELIWNCRSWYASDGPMQPYSRCYDANGRPIQVTDTTAHRDHIHIGLNWLGAHMKTSFWRYGGK